MSEIPPEIEAEMEIKPVVPLPQVKGRLTLEQIERFSPAERILVSGMDENSQICMATYNSFVTFVEQARRSEAKMVRRINSAKQSSLWLAGVLIVAIVTAVASKYIHP